MKAHTFTKIIGLTPLYSWAFAFQLFLAVGKIVIIRYIIAIEGHHETKFKADKLKLLLEHPPFLFVDLTV